MVNDSGGQGQSRNSRRTYLKATAAAGIAGLAGCIGPFGSDDDETIHLLTEEDTEPEQEYWEELTEAFEEETGIEVEVEFLGLTGDGPRQRSVELLQAGNPPELMQLSLAQATDFAVQGELVDHQPMIDIYEDQYGSFPEQFILEYDGQPRFLPQLQNPHMKWYRTDVFDEEPNTWEAELRMAEEHDEGEGGTRGEWLANSTQILAPQINILSAGWTNGARICERDGDGNIQVVMDEDPHRQRWIEVFEHRRELQQYSPMNEGIGWGDLMSAVPQEWSYQQIMYGNRGKNVNPEGAAENITNTTWPQPEDNFQEGGGDSMGITFGFLTFQGSNVEAAQEFHEFWSQPEWYFDFFMGNPGHGSPMQSEIYNDPEFQSTLDDALDDWWDYEEDVQPLMEATQNAFDLPLETDPPNPYAAPIMGSQEIASIQIDVNVRDRDIEEALDERADNIRDVIEDTAIE